MLCLLDKRKRSFYRKDGQPDLRFKRFRNENDDLPAQENTGGNMEIEEDDSLSEPE